MIELDVYADERWFLDGKAFLHEIDTLVSDEVPFLLIKRLPNMRVYDIGIETVDVGGLSKDVVYNVKYCKEFDNDSLLYDFDVKLMHIESPTSSERVEAIQSIYFQIIKDNKPTHATPKEGANTID